ncbi:ABC transporter substrate-binding protein [Brevibacillus daliensis]|uniref:ABC transporter substrate-binding protein n=1 Tax=Brevibacillus daliensis TaxID=2892995 RepID=UPI001E547446|nr:ABC transporter substrate-binding protein [Brevibacillus daliensis]
MRQTNRKKRNTLLLSMVTSISLMVSGCGSAPQVTGEAEGGSENGRTGEKSTISIALDWYPNAVHSFLYAAESQGYFSEENLNVEIRMPSDASDPLKLAAINKVDLAISYQTQIIQARSEGLPVKSLGAVVHHPLNTLLVREESSITSPKDLEGKKIGYPSLPLDIEIVKQMVEQDGGDPDKLTFVDVGFNLIPTLTTNQTDAIVGGYLNHEKPILEKNEVPVRMFNPVDYGVPTFYELVIATSDDTLQTKKVELEGFMRAISKGQEYVNEHPEEALAGLLAKEVTEFPLDEEIEKKSLQLLLPLMGVEETTFGSQNKETWQNVMEWMKQKNLITNEVKPEDVMP